MATELNLLIDQGSPFSKKIRVLNADGSNYDLTNHTAKTQFRENVRSSEVSLELSTENSMLVIDVLNNTVEIKPDHTATASLIYKKYVYDLDVINQAGVPTRVVQGIATVSPEVTR